MPTHVQQTHLYGEGFDINESDEQVSVKSLTNEARTVKVTTNTDNVEFQVTDNVDVELTSAGDLDFKSADQGVSFLNGQRVTGEIFGDLEARVNTLQNTAFNSGRSFIRFNDGFTIDRNNIATYEDKNLIYTAKNDKPITGDTTPDIILPNDTEIQASTEAYPIVFEFTHLGGTARLDGQDVNIVRFFLDGTQIGSIRRDEVAIISKESAGADYIIQSGVFDAGDTILPSGVFNLKTDTRIDTLATIATELGAISIVAGDAFRIVTGGTWSGYTIPDGSVLVALIGNPSLLDATDNNDWLVLENPRVNAKSAAFLANYAEDGIVFEASRNIRANAANVKETSSLATGVPLTRAIGGNTTGVGRQVRYDNVPLQFSELVGGTLDMLIGINITSQSGFAIAPQTMILHYSDEIQFSFPLSSVVVNGSSTRLSIQIPNVDYTPILNQDVSLRFIYDFNGVFFNGSYTITMVQNSTVGNLHAPILDLIDRESAILRDELNARLDSVVGQLDSEIQSFDDIDDRISPYKTRSLSSPDVNALFADSTGSDAFPAADGLTQVSSLNPRFTGGTTALFVGIRAGQTGALVNTTQKTSLALDTSEATVDIGESLQVNGVTYFVYRVTGLTAGDVYEVDDITLEQVVAWPDDIDILNADIDRIDAELEHASLNLPDAVVQVLENEVEVKEENIPTSVATDFNKSLGDTGNQTVFLEASPNTISSGVLSSKPIKDTSGDRARRKLVYIPAGNTFSNQGYLSAFDGTDTQDLVTYANGVFSANVLVPAIPQGSSVHTIYPAPQTRVSGQGIWQTIEALTFVNGIPVPEADELFFTRNIPSSTTTLTIQYRGHANGNIFGTGSTTLAGVGGSSEVATSFVLDDGGEQTTVEVRYYPSTRQIRVSEVARVNAGLPTINDVQVILSYQETRVVPATPETVRSVPIEAVTEAGQVFAIRPSATGNLILVGGISEIDTGFPYTTLFGASESGNLVVTGANTVFFDYQDFDPIASTIINLENHETLPQFGLFSTEYTHETTVSFDTQLEARNSAGDLVNLAEEVVLIAPDSTRWRIVVSNTGVLSTTQVV